VLELFDQAGRNAVHVTGLLREFVAEYPERRELAREILDCEHHGDRITRDVFHRLGEPHGRGVPYDTRDLHVLASAVDDIVDYAEQIADTLVLYAIEAPMEQAERLADVLARACRGVGDALGALREGSGLSSHLEVVREQEDEGDRLSREAIAALFSGGVDPMVVIRWKDVFELLEQAIDSCERVANVLEGIELRAGRGRP
jgi:predicted phosphate transport protein (TIGR00153 family)